MMAKRVPAVLLITVALAATLTRIASAAAPPAGKTVTRPYQGVTYIDYRGARPRPVHVHIVQIDLAAPGIRFLVTPYNPSGGKATVKETTLQFLNAHKHEGARIAVNAHFFEPWPAPSPDPGLPTWWGWLPLRPRCTVPVLPRAHRMPIRPSLLTRPSRMPSWPTRPR